MHRIHVAHMQTIFCQSCPYRIKGRMGLLSEFKRPKNETEPPPPKTMIVRLISTPHTPMKFLVYNIVHFPICEQLYAIAKAESSSLQQ